MAIPEYELRLLRREFLDIPDADLFRDDLVFAAARRIVKYDDPSLLDDLPSWVEDGVWDMVRIYMAHGSYKLISNLGEVDHSELVRQLSEIMKRRET